MAGLSYLEVLSLPGDSYMGGLLSVNEVGLPIEFLHSELIRPDKLQLAMYGAAIGKYLLLDVMGKSLVEASQQRSLPVLVAQGEMLALATRVKRPVIHLRQSGMRPLEQAGAVLEETADEVLIQLNDVGGPWHLRYYDRQNFQLEKEKANLLECSSRFDLLEPFSRVRRTIEVLRGQSEG